MVRVFIDPGHGGADPGAVANGLQEKDICLSISLMLRNILVREYTGIFVKLSRTTDRTLTLNERTNMANQWHADLLISVHVNAGGGAGFESFIYCGHMQIKDEQTVGVGCFTMRLCRGAC